MNRALLDRVLLLVQFLLPVVLPFDGYSNDSLRGLLDRRGSEFMKEAAGSGETDGKAVFKRFLAIVTRELGRTDAVLAGNINNGYSSPSVASFPRTEIAWIIHSYARERYKDSVIAYTAELIRFKTFAIDVPNQQNSEFVRQKEFLRSLAEKLGLMFNDVDGYVQEIWIGDGDESFGIMSHSDVQPVDLTGWTSDPWSGAIINGTIWGRGAIDDKGPIVAVMYGMRALLDSGLPLKKKMILLIGTDEESANNDVATYLKTHKAPDKTIVVDYDYPVVCAEKGWCGAWLELPRTNKMPAGHGPYIVDLNAGFSLSIVPDKAVAKLLVAGAKTPDSPGRVMTFVEAKAKAFMRGRKESRLTVEERGDTLVVTAFGKSVHSSVPEQGHNALMDLIVFLDQDVQVLRNEYSLLAKFASRNIGFELNGKALGLAHRDAFMGNVSVACNMFHTTDTTVLLMFNFRVPRGIDSVRISQALEKRYADFNRTFAASLKTTHYISRALYTDPSSPFVQKLLGIYNSVTGEHRNAQSTGGGTYAKRLPNAVVFGPAMPDEEYLGHQHNENIKISTLIKNIELLTHAMVEFGM